jgi:hypothetical protein
MHYRLHPVMFEDFLKHVSIIDTALVKRTPFDVFPVTVNQVVECDGCVASLLKFLAAV